MMRTLRHRPSKRRGHDALQHVRMLGRAPDGDAVRVGRREERVRLDREVRDHRERVVVLDDAIGPGAPHRPSRTATRGERSCASGSCLDANSRILDERRRGIERLLDGEHRRQLFVVDPHEPPPPALAASSVSAATAATGSPKNFVSPTASTGRSLYAGPYRGTGCGRSPAVRTPRTPVNLGRLARVDPVDARACAVQVNELDVQDVVEPDVGGVPLGAGHALDAADARESIAPIQLSAISAAPSRLQPRLDDAAVAAAPAQIAGEAFLDLGDRSATGSSSAGTSRT